MTAVVERNQQPGGLLTSTPIKVGLGLLALITVVASSDDEGGFVLCPFRRCTGGYCPGCGMTRSAGRLVRGDLVGSWHRHPFVLLAALQVVVLGTLWTSSSRLREWLTRRWTMLALANAGLLGAIWIVRLVLADIPVPFS